MIKRTMLMTVSSATLIAAFENKAGWKLDADGKIELKDGNPIYVDSSGREMTVDGSTISSLNQEAKTHREAKEAAQADLAKYHGADGKLIDPEAAKSAIDTVSKIDQKTLIDAGEVDKVRDQVKAEFTTQIDELKGNNTQLQTKLDNYEIDKVFSDSDLVRDGLAVPRDMFEASMRNHFKVVDGKVEAYDRSGNRLMSKEKVGEYASPSEALALLIDAHPQKDTILRADAHNGSGNNGQGGNRGGGRYIKRADFEKMAPAKQKEIADKMGAGELEVVD